jgi:hypothetical protein
MGWTFSERLSTLGIDLLAGVTVLIWCMHFMSELAFPTLIRILESFMQGSGNFKLSRSHSRETSSFGGDT